MENILETSVRRLYVTRPEQFSEEDKRQYSQFKHGSKNIARIYGRRLAQEFIVSGLSETKRIILSPAPYMNIPTASFTLKDYFKSELAILAPWIQIEEMKIHRKHSYSSEYGNMSAEERQNAISADDFSYDPGYCKGKLVLFIDDIRITGSHERRIVEMIKNHDLDYAFLYYASLEDKSVNPAIEGEINEFAVTSQEGLMNVVLNHDFVFNTRVVKKLLRDVHTLTMIIGKSTDRYSFVHTLLSSAILNQYHHDETMIDSISFLRDILDTLT